jgi:hypothetical protein
MRLANRGTSSTTSTLTTQIPTWARRPCGECELDPEAALRQGAELERATVRLGNCGHDREPQPMTVLRAGALLAKVNDVTLSDSPLNCGARV